MRPFTLVSDGDAGFHYLTFLSLLKLSCHESWYWKECKYSFSEMLPDSIWTSQDYFSWLTNATHPKDPKLCGIRQGGRNGPGSSTWFHCTRQSAATIPSWTRFVFWQSSEGRLFSVGRGERRNGWEWVWPEHLQHLHHSLGSNDVYLGESDDVSPAQIPEKQVKLREAKEMTSTIHLVNCKIWDSKIDHAGFTNMNSSFTFATVYMQMFIYIYIYIYMRVCACASIMISKILPHLLYVRDETIDNCGLVDNLESDFHRLSEDS